MKIPNIFIVLISVGLTILSTGNALAQPTQVVATVDKNPVMADESFNLTITADDDVDRSAFDPSPLMQDFVVGRTSVSSQTQMINFNTTRTTIWSTVLIPRKQGRFTIPAFNVAGLQTDPIDIMVVPVTSSSAAQGRDIYITTELDINEVYLQQQLLYTVKLYLGKDLQRGSLANPTLENADIRQIGKDKEYSEIAEGRRYRVIERNFAIIPQQSGQFTIDGPLFEGEVMDNSRQSFGFFNRTTPVNRVGPSQQITVLPIPSNYPEHWLPSDFVQLHEEWQGDPKQYHAGEPITRTLTLTAIGVVEEQLPAINSAYPDSVKTYPDQAETTTVEKDNTLIAQRKESIAIIPSQAGELHIPAVKIAWFNVLTKKTEYTELPAKTLTILPALQQAGSVIPPTITVPQAPAQSVQPQVSVDQTTVAENARSDVWPWLSAGLLLLWLSTLALWYRQHARLRNSQQAHSDASHNNYADLWPRLNQALKNSDIKTIQRLLPPCLGQICGQPQASLAQSLNLLQDRQLRDEVERMLASQYSQQRQTWQADGLAASLKALRKAQVGTKPANFALKTLYPAE